MILLSLARLDQMACCISQQNKRHIGQQSHENFQGLLVDFGVFLEYAVKNPSEKNKSLFLTLFNDIVCSLKTFENQGFLNRYNIGSVLKSIQIFAKKKIKSTF